MEFFDVGATRIVLLKKCASSSLGAELRHRRIGVGRSGTCRYVIAFIRDPYRRLVSGWADLVRRQQLNFAIPAACRDGDEHDFGRWAREIIKVPDSELDHHFRPQVVELLDALDLVPMQPDTQLILGRVENLFDHLPMIHKYVGGDAIRRDRIQWRRKSQHRAVSHYFTDEDLHARVHARFLHDEMLCGIVNDSTQLHISEYWVDPRKYLKDLLKMN